MVPRIFATVRRVETPLLCASQLRVDQDGVAAIDGLSLTTRGARVLVLGAARALFEASSGMRGVTHGELRVGGTNAIDAVHAGTASGAPLDAPLPPDWTPRAYATWSARLCGHAKSDARALADDALGRMKMGSLGDAPLGKAALHVRRATAIAAAIATGAANVLLDDPIATLPDEVARHLAEVMVEALADRAWVVFAARVSLASPMARSAEDAILVAGSHVAAQGSPAALAARDRSYALDVTGDAERLVKELEERGAQVDSRATTLFPKRIVVDLTPALSTRDLLACAAEAGAVIVELRPLARAFA
jgi:ABC-type multidrug transport system ATPase subunit